MNHRGNLSEPLRTRIPHNLLLVLHVDIIRCLLHCATHTGCCCNVVAEASVQGDCTLALYGVTVAGAVCAVVAVMNSLILTPLVRGPQGPMNTPMLTFLSTCYDTPPAVARL
jgi:hypothetical protein